MQQMYTLSPPQRLLVTFNSTFKAGRCELLIEARARAFFPPYKTSRPAPGLTQLPMQWVPGLFPESKTASVWSWPLASIQVARLRMKEQYRHSPYPTLCRGQVKLCLCHDSVRTRAVTRGVPVRQRQYCPAVVVCVKRNLSRMNALVVTL